MKRLLFLLFALYPAGAPAQVPAVVPPNATIERVDLSGLSEARLSPELRADLQKLVGQPYNAQTIDALTGDIQVELPEYVAAATTQPGTAPNSVRVVFVVARISDNDALRTNINSRYIVDAVEFTGRQVRISDELNAEIQKMVGANVDSTLVGKLGERIQRENRNANLEVTWKLQRSTAPQHVRVIYDADRFTNTMGFSGPTGGYHSRQGFSGTIAGFNYTNGPARTTVSISMVNNADDLIERYAGYRAGFAIGIRPIRVTVNYSSLRSQWKPHTLAADSLSLGGPGLYRLRDTLSGAFNVNQPLNAFSLLTATAGVQFTVLQMQSPVPGFQKSNVARGNLAFSQNINRDLNSIGWRLSYDGATGADALNSDFIFTRHQLDADLTYTRSSNALLFDFQAGRLSGNAPMNERFSIGNARTLRGWNKYEINPLGGDRMVYGSAAYRYKVIGAFYDVGTVWDNGQSRELRQSAGVRLGKQRCRNILILPHPDCFSVTVGFPIHGGNARPALIVGMGF